MAKVEMYTKMGCGYCTRARQLLISKGIEFEDIDTTMGGAAREAMLARAPDHRTTPSIFIDGRHIGGSDELAALEASGELDAMLAG